MKLHVPDLSLSLSLSLSVSLSLSGKINATVQPLHYSFSLYTRHYHEKKFWSGTFILLSLGVGFMVILPWLGSLLGGHHPIPLLIFAMISTPVRVSQNYEYYCWRGRN